MKRLVMLSCVLIMVSIICQAQIKVEYGAKAGINFSGLAISSYGKLSGCSYNLRTGFQVGGYATFRKKDLALQPELVFALQGQNFSASNYFSNYRSQLGYINIPVLMKYYLGEGFQVFIGPQFGFLTGAKGDLIQVVNGNFVNPERNQNLSPYFKSTDFSLAFGFEIKFPKNLNLNVRYNSGLTNINKYLDAQSFPNNYQPSVSTGYTRNQSIQISVGYKLSKDKKK